MDSMGDDLSAAGDRLGVELPDRDRRRRPPGGPPQRLRRSRPPRRVSDGGVPPGRRLRRELHPQRGRRAGLPATRPRRARVPGRGHPDWVPAAADARRAGAPVLSLRRRPRADGAAAPAARCACGSSRFPFTSSRRCWRWPPAPWWALGLLWPALYVLALLATSLWMTARHRSACGLWAGPAAAVMHTAWGFGFLLSWLATREPRWRPEHGGAARAGPAKGRSGGSSMNRELRALMVDPSLFTAPYDAALDRRPARVGDEPRLGSAARPGRGDRQEIPAARVLPMFYRRVDQLQRAPGGAANRAEGGRAPVGPASAGRAGLHAALRTSSTSSGWWSRRWICWRCASSAVARRWC